MAIIPGTIINKRYEIIKELGKGGFGTTYLVKDTRRFGSKCALKHLNPDDPVNFVIAKKLFEREAQTLLKLNEPPRHDQIALFFDYFDENQEFYLVQEYIEGHPLIEELPVGKKLDENKVVCFLEDVLKILKFVHGRKVIHRDIKPENLIRRDGDGKLVLIDFGAVAVKTALARSANPTKPTIIGTLGYAPREQLQGKPEFNSDIYALGMTAIQAVTGVYPNKLPTHPCKAEVIWRDKAQVSNGLAKILDKMVQDNHQQRYQSLEEILNELQKLQKTQRLPNPNPKPLIPLWLAFVILGSIVAIAALGVGFIIFKSPAPPLPPQPTSSPSPDNNQSSPTPSPTTSNSEPRSIFLRPESPQPTSSPSPINNRPSPTSSPTTSNSEPRSIFLRPKSSPATSNSVSPSENPTPP
ncbi:serine/threonine-protein kinase [Coleofasciculus sp. FACHB-1120]|uniref:serine/threonine-protein kinase n=1 Tax=Coleofasciculus sp. FACHB-1120 TaxID=2692783 RepID=UPI00168399B8|nr:serine/threonine-protein kinase [Coleofasciculus sp. FACHB-1120]MBD2740640.1 serine/threonine protein kinase [Coleofasciculus sp. FACHB-1120]